VRTAACDAPCCIDQCRYWNETQSVEVDLVKGSNTLVFSRYSTTPTTFKQFTLYTKKPTIQAPPANYTPKAITPPPPTGAFILESPDTSCLKQGILEVPAQYCTEACTVLGFKAGGARARPTPPGCFVMMDGPFKGNCNYNSNASAVCDNPPCTLSVKQSRQVTPSVGGTLDFVGLSARMHTQGPSGGASYVEISKGN